MDPCNEANLRGIVSRAFSRFPAEIAAATVRFECLHDQKSFWSKIARAHIEWPANVDENAVDEDGKATFPKKVFIKLPTVGENVKSLDDPQARLDTENTLKEITQTEVDFYHHLLSRQIPGFRTPHYYLAEPVVEVGTGCLVAEDMQLSLGHIFSAEYVPGFTLQQVDELMRALGYFHHFLLTQQGRVWEQKFGGQKRISEDFQTMQFNHAKDLASKYPAMFGDKVEQIQHVFTTEHAIQGRTGFKEHGIPPVIVHGDMNPTNVLWTGEKDKSEIGAIIDFQLVAVGSVCEDIVRILSLGLCKKDRHECKDRALTIYHETLSSLYHGLPPFTIDEAKAEYARVFPFACNFGLFGLSCYHGQLLEKEGISDKEKDSTLTEYANRALGIVDDIIALTSAPQ